MKRALIVVLAFLSLAVSAALAAPPADKGKPDKPGQSATAPGQSADKNSAKQKCKAERAADRAAYKAKYGSNGLGKCMAGQKQQSEDDEVTDAEKNAAKKCKAERADIGVDHFKAKYGTNANKANAFGKCVSKLSKEKHSTS
jgi:predicted lipid-binding transport protein (Tim44 family)